MLKHKTCHWNKLLNYVHNKVRRDFRDVHHLAVVCVYVFERKLLLMETSCNMFSCKVEFASFGNILLGSRCFTSVLHDRCLLHETFQTCWSTLCFEGEVKKLYQDSPSLITISISFLIASTKTFISVSFNIPCFTCDLIWVPLRQFIFVTHKLMVSSEAAKKCGRLEQTNVMKF